MKVSEMIRRAGLSDREILDAVSAAKKALKAAETRAQRQSHKLTEQAFDKFDGADDVGRAARENAILRAQRKASEAMSKARRTYNQKLEDLRAKAGPWGDLIPQNIPE